LSLTVSTELKCRKPKSLTIASAWLKNGTILLNFVLCCLFNAAGVYQSVEGFEGTSTLPDVVYRGDTFPGLGFMLKKSFYVKEMQNRMATCCLKRYLYTVARNN